jgi:FdhD protein
MMAMEICGCDMASDLPSPTSRVFETSWRRGTAQNDTRIVPEETAIALVYDKATEAVMMATPADLEDFGVGFSLTEGIVQSAGEIRDLEVVRHPLGVEVRMELAAAQREKADTRRRFRAGPAGCGLCGIESLEAAMRGLPRVRASLRTDSETIHTAMRALSGRQELNRETRAVHAAAFYAPEDGSIVVREDVGRHNALDKVAGALARSNRRAGDGIVVLTSRVSVELVQKTAMMGASVLAAISAPTALALRVAEEAGICVIGIVRDDGMEVFTYPERITRG